MSDSSISFTKKVPIVMKKDVVVVGGGPTGVPAAIASARAGASTALIEQYGSVGGQVNQGIPFIGFLDGKGTKIIRGIGDEIVERLVQLKASPGHIPDEHEISFTPVDPRMYNAVAFQMLREAGVEVLLNSFFGDVIMEGSRINDVVITNKSGYQAIEGRVFVDATGDADVAARANAPFVKGRKSDGKMMPILSALTFYNVDWDKFRAALMENPELYDMDPNTPGISGEGMKAEYFQKVKFIDFWGFRNLVKKAMKKGYKPGNDRICVFCPDGMHQGAYIIFEDEVDSTNAQDVSRAQMELKMKIPDVVKFIHDCLPGWKNAVLIGAPPILGVQDSRVIIGEYILTKDDLLNSRRFPDVIAIGHAKIDDWDTYRMVYPKDNYDVPYRCLIPQKVENLLIGGRSISATREAMMALRMMSMCAATGHAAGAAAALCAKSNVTPRELDYILLRDFLLRQGAYLS